MYEMQTNRSLCDKLELGLSHKTLWYSISCQQVKNKESILGVYLIYQE